MDSQDRSDRRADAAREPASGRERVDAVDRAVDDEPGQIGAESNDAESTDDAGTPDAADDSDYDVDADDDGGYAQYDVDDLDDLDDDSEFDEYDRWKQPPQAPIRHLRRGDFD